MTENMKRIITISCFILLYIAAPAQTEKHINDFVSDSAFRHAGISVCFRDADSGNIIASHNKDMALGSASVMKLVTTAAALETLGPDFTFITKIGYTGSLNAADSTLNGYLVIKGGADPTVLSEYFPDHQPDITDLWAEAICRAGIKKVKGSVISDARVFDYHPAPGGWNWSDLGNYYGAGAHGICLFDNMYRIHFSTGDKGSRPEITAIEPGIPGLTLENRLIASGKRDNGYVYLEPYGSHAAIKGEIPPDRDDFVLKASIPDPPLLAAGLLQEALENRGVDFEKRPASIRLSPSFVYKHRSSPEMVVLTSYSPPLSEIIRVTNTESVNMFAEQILKYMGYVYSGDETATVESGLEATGRFLEENMDNTEGIYMTDGSGLSRSNALSASFITSLLHYMKSSRYPVHYFNSLAEAGETGTLQYYFKDPVFRDRLRAKSGTSTRIRNYAGLLTTREGTDVAFAVLVNNFDCSSSEVTESVERLLKNIINSL